MRFVGGLVVVAILLVSVAVLSKQRTRPQNAPEPQHPVMDQLAAPGIRFTEVNVSTPGRDSSGPAPLDFSNRGGKGEEDGAIRKI